MGARHRVSKQLLRHGQVYSDGSTWGSARHRQWLAARAFADPLSELAYSEALAHVDALTHRKAVLAERLSRLASDEQWSPTVARLRCFRGIDTLTAMMLHLELGADWQRFATPARLMSWLGLTPSLHQSGESRTQGAITKTGSRLARRLLVEAAWHYGRPPGSARRCAAAKPASPKRSSPPPGAPSTACTASTTASVSAASPPTSRPSRARASSQASSGRRPLLSSTS